MLCYSIRGLQSFSGIIEGVGNYSFLMQKIGRGVAR